MTLTAPTPTTDATAPVAVPPSGAAGGRSGSSSPSS
jgi:hypothetical protein